MAPTGNKTRREIQSNLLFELTRDVDHANTQIKTLRQIMPEIPVIPHDKLMEHFWELTQTHGQGKVIPFASDIHDGQFSNFSQDYAFNFRGHRFRCPEMAYCHTMATRAKLPALADEIMDCTHPAACKVLTRERFNVWAPGFKEGKKWHAGKNSRLVMRAILICKYQQNPAALEQLMNTGDAYLAEALRDLRWGCGFTHENWHEYIVGLGMEPSSWPGANWAGIVLMEVREYFRHLSKYHMGRVGSGPIPFGTDKAGRDTNLRIVGRYPFPPRKGTPTPAPQADLNRTERPKAPEAAAASTSTGWLQRQEPQAHRRITPPVLPEATKTPTTTPAEVPAPEGGPPQVSGSYGGLGTSVPEPVPVPTEALFPGGDEPLPPRTEKRDRSLRSQNRAPKRPLQSPERTQQLSRGPFAINRPRMTTYKSTTFRVHKGKITRPPPKKATVARALRRSRAAQKVRPLKQSRVALPPQQALRSQNPPPVLEMRPSTPIVQPDPPQPEHRTTPVVAVTIPALPSVCGNCSQPHRGECPHQTMQPLRFGGMECTVNIGGRAYIGSWTPGGPPPPTSVGPFLPLRRQNQHTMVWEERRENGVWGPMRDLGRPRYWTQPDRCAPNGYIWQVETGPPNFHLIDMAQAEATWMNATRPMDAPNIPVPPRERRGFMAPTDVELPSEVNNRACEMVNAFRSQHFPGGF